MNPNCPSCTDRGQGPCVSVFASILTLCTNVQCRSASSTNTKHDARQVDHGNERCRGVNIEPLGKSFDGSWLMALIKANELAFGSRFDADKYITNTFLSLSLHIYHRIPCESEMSFTPALPFESMQARCTYCDSRNSYMSRNIARVVVA